MGLNATRLPLDMEAVNILPLDVKRVNIELEI